ncbi:MAG: TetR/AcrR family transcriptional regulator C-terminal ligand-binding domain-containing protein [Acidimicrobiales bacterium]|nr:TetR/AcrR family transcriptional regulator C-terminal ligand-binding domain-containing protein [Acidimicrobiales bacterium]
MEYAVAQGDAHPRSRGRPRDGAIDEAVLAATLDELSVHGYDGLAVVAVARAAGTTRQAVYRRWPTKAALAVAAIAALPEAADLEPTGDHRADLLAELEAFRRGVLRPGGVSMVGSMLQDAADPELRGAYRERIVAPRRRRLRAILAAAVADGTLPERTDLDLLVAGCTGTFYALALAGEVPGRDWPDRMVTQVFGEQSTRSR